MFKITVATKNPKKFSSIKNLILRTTVGKCVKILPLPLNIKSPAEPGKTSLENALFKAKYYKKHLKGPFVVMDDEIFFKPKIGIKLKQNFHRLNGKFDVSPKSIFIYLQKQLLERSPVKLTRTRNIIFNFGREQKVFKNKFQCNLEPLENNIFDKLRKSKLHDNPLNYFSMVQNKVQSRLWELSSQERNKLIYNKTSINKVNSIFEKYLDI